MWGRRGLPDVNTNGHLNNTATFYGFAIKIVFKIEVICCVIV